MTIDYDHKSNLHTASGPKAALPLILGSSVPTSVLDVGCGLGTWLKAFGDLGVTDHFGVDGVAISTPDLLINPNRFMVVDFRKPWSLGRKFEMAICLEVAEHLPQDCSERLVEALTEHSDQIVFSAACPGQPGQNHINCNWPEFWQALFNKKGFACWDNIRPKIWHNPEIEVWYRQNAFSASRSNEAGKEPRLPGMIHSEFSPSFLSLAKASGEFEASRSINGGMLPLTEYFRMVATALAGRVRRKLS